MNMLKESVTDNKYAAIADFPITRVLVVDDEDSLRLVLAKSLQRAGFFCFDVDSAEKALEEIDSQNFDLVISDIAMPEMDGIELLKTVKSKHPDIDFIMMTGYGSDYSYVDIMDAGASDYMTKPFELNSILARIKRIAREKKNLLSLRKTNQELCAAIERANILARQAKEASKAKTFFLASMSHEIRTPLNGIVGYTDMLMDTPLNEEQVSFLKNAKFSCDTLLSVVNDILDFSKVEAGKMTLENISFDPEVLCFDTIDIIRTRVDESRVELVCSVSDSVPGQVMGDPHRFRQVLLNLLGNAAKFTHQGFIKLDIDSSPADKNHCNLIVSVSDSGIGIPPSRIDKIFNPFVQSKDDIASKYGGTGLGLAISKNIALRMGGDIRAESVVGKGSVFYFTSCLELAENKRAKRIRPARLKGGKILVCTVSDQTYEILSHELDLAGMKVFRAEFENFHDFLENQPDTAGFDAGLIDFGKSVVKDIEAELDFKIRCIRPEQLGFKCIACSIPVPGIAKIFQKAGFKGFLPKPVSRIKLFDMLSYVMGMGKECPAFDAEPEEKHEILTSHLLSENKKSTASILLVEDNPVNQKMTHIMLSKAGYMIDIASDGKQALEKYISDPDAYDIILMDINMPEMNGFEATEKIRLFEKENNLSPIPILALTANVLENFRQECKRVGMDGFLTKPIKRNIVFQAIQKWAHARDTGPV